MAKRQSPQWSKEKGQKDNNLQNITQKNKDRITRTPLKTGGEHMLHYISECNGDDKYTQL